MSLRSRGHSFHVGLPRYKYNLTIENLSFSGVYIITDNFSEHAYVTCLCNDWFTFLAVAAARAA